MKRWVSLALACGLVSVASGRAEEIPWRKAVVQPPPTRAIVAEPSSLAGAVQLGRPEPLATGVVPTAFREEALPEPMRLPLPTDQQLPTIATSTGREPGPLALTFQHAPKLGDPDKPTFASLSLTRPPSQAAPASVAAVAEAGHAPGAAVPMRPFCEPGSVEVPLVTDTWERLNSVAPGYEPDDYGGVGADWTRRTTTRVYFTADYLLWMLKGDRVPALLTTGPVDPTQAYPGSLGRPGTTVLIGDGTLDNRARSGVRGNFGVWCDDEHTFAAELGFFSLPNRGKTQSVSSNAVSLLARPFFRINSTGQVNGQPLPPGEAVELAAFPGLSTGTVSVSTQSEFFGIEPNLRWCLCQGCFCNGPGYRVQALAGLRFMRLEEELSILENLNVNANVLANMPNGGRAFVFDRFHTRNDFFGGQVGLDAELQWGRWTLGLQGKLALGGTRQIIDIQGSQLLIDNALGARTFTGGLLALPSNIGHYSSNQFSVVPEVGLKVGYDINAHLRVTAGYSALYWTNVVRPGDQIDRNLDVTTIPNFSTLPGETPAGQNRPRPVQQTSDFWAQGLSVGLEIRY